MKTKALFKNTILALLAGGFVGSCISDEETEFSVKTDVYYVSKKIENVKKTGVAYYAYGNKSMSSAIVTLPGGGTKSLLDTYDYSYTLFDDPADSELTVGYPAEGTYTFDVVNEKGTALKSSDLLEIANLEIPVIEKVEYSSINANYKLSWNTVPNAETFVVKLMDSTGKIIFSGYAVEKNVKEYTVDQNLSGNWAEPPVIGKTYTFQLWAFNFEADAGDTNFVFNLQEISIGEIETVWK